MLKKSLVFAGAAFLMAFSTAFAAEDVVVPPGEPLKPVIRSEGQMVAETVCPAMQKDETYATSSMAAFKKIVAGDDGWVFRSSPDLDFRVNFSLLPKTTAYMKTLQDAFAARGIAFIYLIPPTRGIAQGMHATGTDPQSVTFRVKRGQASANYQSMLQQMKVHGIHVVGFPNLNDGKAYFYKRDHHWNPYGAKLAAARTAGFIKGMPVYAQLQKTSFATKNTGTYAYNGPLKDVLFDVCKLVLPAEQTERYVTERAGAADAAGALFDEAGFPEVVLIGTSNSSADPSVANFEGFLKEALGTDIYNASMVGAGIDAPLLAYLNSNEYKTHKPKIIIWETPGYYNQDYMHSRVYRQAIPAITGDCEGNALAEARGVEIKGGKQLVLDGLAPKRMDGGNYYLAMKFSKPVKDPVIIGFGYAAREDTYKVTRPARFGDDAQYYMLLKSLKLGALHKVSLELPAAMAGQSVDVRMCRLAGAAAPGAAAVSKK